MEDYSFIPAVNASLNATATLLISSAFVFIKKGNIMAHRRCMKSALAVSAVFLALYVTHKILLGGVHTKFPGEGLIVYIYFPMLISHVFLAICILPLIFITLNHAIKGRVEKHKAWAKWTFPIWYYVSVTGVLVYFFIYQWYPAE